MKLQGTWVGLGGIGLFIQTRLTQILLERNSGDTVESTFKNLLSFLLRSYWQGDKKTKLPDAWDVSSIFRLLYTRCILFHLSAHAGIGVTRFEQRQAATPAHRLLLCLAAAPSELGCPEEDPRGWNRCSQPPSSEAAGPCAPALTDARSSRGAATPSSPLTPSPHFCIFLRSTRCWRGKPGRDPAVAASLSDTFQF